MTCPHCNGACVVEAQRRTYVPCHGCGHTGALGRERCHDCAGTGQVIAVRWVMDACPACVAREEARWRLAGRVAA